MRLFAMMLTVGLASVSCTQASSEDAGCTPDFTGVEQYIENLVTTLNLDGVGIHVEQRGQVLMHRYFGDYGPNTIIPIASATKWISGAVVMSLVDEGLISLDDTTGQWLGWTGPRGEITIRQLFSHTSGMDPNEPPCVGDPQSTLAACVADIAAQPLVAAPGTELNYGSSSMQVAGYICTLAANQTWGQVFQSRIRGPLGMNRTFFNSSTNPRIDGGIGSTLDDYVVFLRMIARGGLHDGQQVLSPGAVAAMLADQTGSALQNYTPPCIDVYGGYNGYGVGVWIGPPDATGSPVRTMSPGRFSFTPWIDHERDLFVVFMVERELMCPFIDSVREQIELAIDSARPANANCSARVDFADIDLFVAALSNNLAAYVAAGGSAECWEKRSCWGDFNSNGLVDFADIDPFVVALSQER